MDNFDFERWQSHTDELCRQASKQKYKDDTSFYSDTASKKQSTIATNYDTKRIYINETPLENPERSYCYFENKKFQFKRYCKSTSIYDNDYKFISEAEFKQYTLDKGEPQMKKFTEAEKYYLSFEDLTPEQEQYLRTNNYKAFWKSRGEQEAEKARVAKYYASQKKAEQLRKQKLAAAKQKPTYTTLQRVVAAGLGALVAITISAGFNKTDAYHRTALEDLVEASQFEDTKGERIK